MRHGQRTFRDDAVDPLPRKRRFGVTVLVAASLLACASCSTGGGRSAESVPDSTESAATSVPPDGAAYEGLVRATVDGVTFLYPEELFVGVDSPAPPDGPAVVVTLLGRNPNGGDALVSVRTLRDRSGEFLASATDKDRDLVAQLETGSLPGEQLDFVNGAGARTLNEDRYVFDGITGEGVQLVAVEASMPAGIDASQTIAGLDALVGSIFVDGAALVYQDSCQTGVEVVSGVDLDPGGEVAPGDIVTASWTTRNNGTCPWTEADSWVFTGGDPVTMLGGGSLASIAPGGEHDVALTFRAPDATGAYAVQWQLLPSGQLKPLPPIQAVSFEVVAN